MIGPLLTAVAFALIAAPNDESGQPAAAEGIEPIDFTLAYETARRGVKTGATLDEAVELAERVLSGEAPFAAIDAPTGTGNWLYAENWLTAGDAKLLQHEVITEKGWPTVGDLDAPRVLQLSAPLPAWADALAEKLTPALGNVRPDECTVHACEPGQRTQPLELGEGGTVAILSLFSSAALLTAQDEEDPERFPFPSRSTRALDERSVLLLTADARANAAAWGHCVHSGSRHLSLVFRCTKPHKA